MRNFLKKVKLKTMSMLESMKIVSDGKFLGLPTKAIEYSMGTGYIRAMEIFKQSHVKAQYEYIDEINDPELKKEFEHRYTTSVVIFTTATLFLLVFGIGVLLNGYILLGSIFLTTLISPYIYYLIVNNS